MNITNGSFLVSNHFGTFTLVIKDGKSSPNTEDAINAANFELSANKSSPSPNETESKFIESWLSGLPKKVEVKTMSVNEVPQNMKPTITSIQGSSPAGMEDPSTDNQAQSIEVRGTNFGSVDILLIVGPDPKDRTKEYLQASRKGTAQGLQIQNDTFLIAVVKFPIDTNGPHQALVITSDGNASEWFSFNVK
jgi:hypothetical protein